MQGSSDPIPAAPERPPPGLRYVNDDEPGIRRVKRGDTFVYKTSSGKTIRDKATLERIRSLAIPPAYTDVWISERANGHIQATGRDARGRKQYRYHLKWREHRDTRKYEHVLEFARALPAIRTRVKADMGRAGLAREKVVATVVSLLEQTLIRVGNEDYARDNKSYGLTTLREKHIDVSGATLNFHFTGKSGKDWDIKLSDRRVAKVVRQCQDLPGQHLFQYVDDDGERHNVTSEDVNTYLHDIAECDVTAKDFRTWAGTVLAALALAEFEAFDSPTLAKKNIKAAIQTVAKKLGNTPTICRKCYVHPEIVTTYLDGTLAAELEMKAAKEFEHLADLRPEEAAVVALLLRRLQAESAKKRVVEKPSAKQRQPRVASARKAA